MFSPIHVFHNLDLLPFKFLVLPLTDLLVSSVIALQPTAFWRRAFLVLHCAISISFVFSGVDYATTVQGYTLRCSLVENFLVACHLIALSDPLVQFRHELDIVPPWKRSLPYRFYWAISIYMNRRGVGLINEQVPYIPPPPVETRWRFVRTRLLRAFGYFILTDIAHTYMSTNPQFTPASICESPLTCQGYFLGFVTILAFPCAVYAAINLGYNVISVLVVAIGISEAKYWPDFFGPVSEAYTVRRFWGRFWHQKMRRFLVAIGKYVARSLGFNPGTKASSSIQLCVAFILSGIIHSAGDVGTGYLGISLVFFFLQAIIIMLEDTVLSVAKRAGLTGPLLLTRLIGYTWVSLWFISLMPWMIRWSVHVGFTTSKLLPFSPAAMVLTMIEKHYGRNISSFFN